MGYLFVLVAKGVEPDKGGRGNWVFPRVGNYSKPRVLKERVVRATGSSEADSRWVHKKHISFIEVFLFWLTNFNILIVRQICNICFHFYIVLDIN